MSDYRQQQQAQEEIEHDIIEALDRVATGTSTADDARLLAWASGIQYQPAKEHSHAMEG